ncbi:MAG: Nif11-like leader peptide family natural product precursor [Opitutales bacterium]|nr:Nif11-like leader peptide family natural product precursor [Opitutales bacterium]
MSQENVEKLLLAGGADKHLRAKYNVVKNKEEFVSMAAADGYDFTLEELDAVLKEEGLTFESTGNPPFRAIWLR